MVHKLVGIPFSRIESEIVHSRILLIHQPQPAMFVLQISLMPSRMPYGTFLRMLASLTATPDLRWVFKQVAVSGGLVRAGILRCRAGLES